MLRLRGNDDIEDLLRETLTYVLVGEREKYLDENVDKETKRLIEIVRGNTGGMISALLQMRGVLEDIELTISMFNRYPWHGTLITKTKHLELCWYLFQNLCYGFREKVKHFFNYQKLPSSQLSLGEPSWLRAELSFIEKSMAKPIRDRGNTIHGWNVRHSSIDLYSMVSLLASQGDEEFASRLSGHYSDTKYEIRREAKKVFIDAYSCYRRILNEHSPTPKQIVCTFNKLVADVNSSRITLSVA